MLNTLVMEFTCAILAGGASVRMGKDKATMEIKNRPLIGHVYDRIKGIFDDIIIISNNPQVMNDEGVPVVKDIVPIQSTLTGIVSALIHSRNPYVFIVACDMPNISTDGIRYMLENIKGEDIIIPRIDKGFEPLHAIYSRSCITYMLRLLEKRDFRISSVFSYVQVKVIEDNPHFYHKGRSVFININRMEDLNLLDDLWTP
ncbi:MAG TPA: molybdenum cofactor guanylyltransferase [Syntrophorhabdaceae bacterium]|nr:molybdenum cofactor guanylyltransferase [Syntrophorhabdaceae bacterium]HPP42039.1 molybdenum cofactor guanylyltransferase [Syntrophorhabdaceae bacterium]